MADRPIIFSAPMVRALREGRKTQTRRIINPQPPKEEDFRGSSFGLCRAVADGVKMYSLNDYARLPKHPTKWDLDGSVGVARRAGFPMSYDVRFAIGDRLWVREAWRPGAWRNDGRIAADYRATPEENRTPWIDVPEGVWEDLWPRLSEEAEQAVVAGRGSVRVDGDRFKWDRGDSPCRWRPSIHMPRWASRLTLAVTDVRVERLQDMNGQHPIESDAIKEGVNAIHHGDGEYYYSAFRTEPDPHNWVDPTDAFQELWTSIYGPDAWAANPWVAAISFDVRHCNIDAMKEAA